MAASKWVERSRAAFVHGAGSRLNREVNQGVLPNRRNYRFGMSELLGVIRRSPLRQIIHGPWKAAFEPVCNRTGFE